MEENNTVYAVEETEKGMTLTHYLKLRARTLTPVEARTLLQPVMEGVALLHKAGLSTAASARITSCCLLTVPPG